MIATRTERCDMLTMKKIFVLSFVILNISLSQAGVLRDSTLLNPSRDSVFTIIPQNVPSYDMAFEAPDLLMDGMVSAPANDSIQRYIDFTRSVIEKVRQLN